MIKNLFIPEQIRGYYLFPVRILGFDIGKTHVRATKIYCKGREIIVEKCFQEAIAHDARDSQEATALAIKAIIEQARPFDTIFSSIASSHAVFKELKLPFIGAETIGKVIEYEVEPLLPFSLSDAIIDYIVTKEIPQEKSSQVLVAAVQNHYIAQHLALFDAAQVQPEKVTIDLFALYGLYSISPLYASQTGGIVLLEIENDSTRIAYLYDGQLRFIRILPKGLANIATAVATTLSIASEEAMEHIIRFGLEANHNDAYIAAIKQAFTSFFNEIIFTLQSFTTQAKPAQSLHKIVVFGTSASIKGLTSLITDLAQVKSEIFSLNGLIHNGLHISAKSSIPQENLISFATALPSIPTASFDLRKKEFALVYNKAFLQQFITGTLLLLFILGSLLGNTIWQISKLKREAYQSEQETIESLQERIKTIPEDVTSLDDALEQARSEVNQEEKVWSAFSSSSRFRFLEYLVELTNKIDKATLGMDIERITITPETIVLRANVRGWEELHTLERDLRNSTLFSYVESAPDPKFVTTGMTIRIKKSGARR